MTTFMEKNAEKLISFEQNVAPIDRIESNRCYKIPQLKCTF